MNPFLYLLFGFILLIIDKVFLNIVWACTVNRPMSTWSYADSQTHAIWGIPRVEKKYSLVFGKQLSMFFWFLIFGFVVALFRNKPVHNVLAIVFCVLYFVIYFICSFPQYMMKGNYKEMDADIRKSFKFDRLVISVTNAFCLLYGVVLFLMRL